MCRKHVENIHLTLQRSPKASHRSIIQAPTRPGHTLLAAGIFQHPTERFGGILIASVTMKEWLCLRILCNGERKGSEHQIIVIIVPYDVGDNAIASKIQNGT